MRLNPLTLATEGRDLLGVLSGGQSFSAHPKVHQASQDVWNFGITYHMNPLRGMQASLKMYQWGASGQAHLRHSTVLPFPGAAHDFCLTDSKAVVVIPPLSFQSWPLKWLMGHESLGRMMKWKPELETRVMVLDLKSGAVQWSKAPPLVMQHTVNAWDEDGGVTMDVCDAGDASRWDMWFDVMDGEVEPRQLGQVRRLHIDSAGAVTSRPHPHIEMEFPMVDPRFVSKAHSVLFGVTWDEESPFFGNPMRLDINTGHIALAPLALGEFAGECLLVNKSGEGHAEGDVYVLSVVLNTVDQRSELRIYDGARLEDGALGRAILPHAVPFGFHGVAVNNAALPQEA